MTTVCNNYVSPSGLYTWMFPGTYKDTITNVAGCDSIITIVLSIPTVITGVTVNGAALTANAINASFQWIDCSTMLPIAGANNNTFIATINGTYAVIVTQNGCTDTSACYTINNVGINENAKNNFFSLFPNPSSGKVNITSPSSIAQLKVINLTGQIIQQFSPHQKNVLLHIADEGVFFVSITTADETVIRKVMVQR